jgi:hypothetical protein
LFEIASVSVGDPFTLQPQLHDYRAAWSKLVSGTDVKAFFKIIASPNVFEGCRAVIQSCGLGAMQSNIVILGIFHLLA